MGTLVQDLRYGIRQLRKHPHFALTACLSLAFGIGATVSVFSIIYAVVINPFPYAEPSRICWLSLDLRFTSLSSAILPDFTQIFVRTSVAPRLLEHAVRAQITKVDPQQQALWTEDGLMEEALHDQPL